MKNLLVFIALLVCTVKWSSAQDSTIVDFRALVAEDPSTFNAWIQDPATLRDYKMNMNELISYIVDGTFGLNVESIPTTCGDNETITGDGAGAMNCIHEAKFLPARKGSAGTISKGQAVYISGYNVGGGWVEVETCDADDAAKMPCVGLAYEALTNGADGHVLVQGILEGFATDTWSVGDELWISTSAGTLTSTKPVGDPNTAIQKLAIVSRSNLVNGSLVVFGAGRSNDIPNMTSATLAASVSDESGTGPLLFGTNPTISGWSFSGSNLISPLNGVLDLATNIGHISVTGTSEIRDPNGNELIKFSYNGSATHELGFLNGTAGSQLGPTIYVTGDAGAADLSIQAKSGGTINAENNLYAWQNFNVQGETTLDDTLHVGVMRGPQPEVGIEVWGKNTPNDALAYEHDSGWMRLVDKSSSTDAQLKLDHNEIMALGGSLNFVDDVMFESFVGGDADSLILDNGGTKSWSEWGVGAGTYVYMNDGANAGEVYIVESLATTTYSNDTAILRTDWVQKPIGNKTAVTTDMELGSTTTLWMQDYGGPVIFHDWASGPQEILRFNHYNQKPIGTGPSHWLSLFMSETDDLASAGSAGSEDAVQFKPAIGNSEQTADHFGYNFDQSTWFFDESPAGIADEECWYLEDPVTDEELYTVWRAPVALTVDELYCEVTGGTSVEADLEIDDGTPTGINGSVITCTTSGVTDGTLAGDVNAAAGDRIDIDLGTVTGTVTSFSICMKYTHD